jgi:nitroreductase
MIQELVVKNRSYRRFASDTAISEDTLRQLVNLGRLSATGRNLQPLKYMLSCDADKNARVFATLSWAGYLGGWSPADNERPTAYIVMLGDKDIATSFSVDEGIAAQSILLGAVEMGLGGCMISSIRRVELAAAMAIPEKYEILLVIALGKPVEVVQIEPMGANGSVKYWRDADKVHHLPKRALDDVIIK